MISNAEKTKEKVSLFEAAEKWFARVAMRARFALAEAC
jgi:hypothetical protein